MKKKGIIERLVMGKKRDKDLTENDLPSTRFKQFAFVFRTRLGVIFRLNLISALFFLPFMAWDILAGGYVADFVAGMTAEERFSHLIYLTLLQYGTEIPLLMLGFSGLAGIYYAVRRVCWGQSVKIFADFGKGLKQSFVQFMLLGLMTGVINLIVNYFVQFVLITSESADALLWALALTIVLLLAVIWAIVLMFALAQSSLYKLSFPKLLLNSFMFTFKRLFKSLAVCFIALLPLLVFAFMPWLIARIIGCCTAIVFSIGFAVTVQTVYCHGVFDKFINAKSYPDFVGMGLAGAKDITEAGGEAEEQ